MSFIFSLRGFGLGRAKVTDKVERSLVEFAVRHYCLWLKPLNMSMETRSPCLRATEEVENNTGNDKLHLSWDNCWFALTTSSLHSRVLTTTDGRMASTNNVCPEKLKLPPTPQPLNILQYSCLCFCVDTYNGRRESGKILWISCCLNVIILCALFSTGTNHRHHHHGPEEMFC